MGNDTQGSQLELFDLSRQSKLRPQRQSFGRLLLQLRYDQLLLMLMASVIGATVIFAFGVERGKQLARADFMQMASDKPQEAVTPASITDNEAEPGIPVLTPLETPEKIKTNTAPATVSKKVRTQVVIDPVEEEEPAVEEEKVVRKHSASRYAIQVVTYSSPVLAKKEMDRLRAKGERAFIVMRGKHTVLYVGPFTSRDNAATKIASLKSRYNDCFVKTL